ncbi:reverse transcriptase family protein [Lelliottia sp. CFBP8978]|uniref:reverse transcriptase family protein n=1 Tax=Lelliottia sp. CFBP8978 TaxID=3096522 RepID=UPI002A6B1A4C|nr:reverse transcriptase family protein [Lelliottia sp. CFBP8978]MDY1037523.1 reverse transcriptase family protein [Lelliottia sp. CFBP8978]
MNVQNFIDTLNLEDIKPSLISPIIASPSSFYRQFKLQKKRGGFREINAPYPFLDFIQKKIYHFLDERFAPHEAVFAYTHGKNAILHAEKHVKSDVLLVLDISDFFGNITNSKIFNSLINMGINASTASVITSLCCLNNRIPQGSSTSPILSNIIFHSIDNRLNALALKFNLIYSRYADDLAFSGNHIPKNFKKYVCGILSENGFSINKDKTKIKMKNSKKILTGVSITNGTMKCPRKFKRELRKDIFILEKNINDLSAITPLDPLIYERILGKINYLLQIEPNNGFFQNKKLEISRHHLKFLGR